MNKKSFLFEYQDYKEYIKDRIEAETQNRGLKLRMAEHVRCQPSYLSQVLHAKSDFTLEQASRLNTFLHHSPQEARFFILLVEWARAGTEDLKDIFLSQIKETQKARFNLKKRLPQTEDIPESAQHKYYSVWFYSAIHVALSVPGLQSPKKLAQAFHLPLSLTTEAIHFLEEIGLVESYRGGFRVTKKKIHLGSESDFIRRHHINWRSQALQSVERGLPEDLHYSSVLAIAEADSQKIKDILIQAIENTRKVVAPSKEEKVYAISLDFFRL